MSRREQIAVEEVGHTSVRAGIAAAIVIVFVATLLPVPVLQLADGKSVGGGPPVAQLARDAMRHPLEANRRLLSWMRDLERTLDRESPLVERLAPRLQYMITWALGAGNEQVYPGREGWLHYRPDIDYVTSPGFLDPLVMRRRVLDVDSWQRPPQPDPARAIADFKASLGDIPLIVVPVPGKSCLRPDTFADVSIVTPLQNSSYNELCERLREAGVTVFNAAGALAELKERSDLYLRTDTHWRPESVEAVARGIAAEIERTGRLTGATSRFQRSPGTVAATGDLIRLLSLPSSQSLYAPEEVAVNRVHAADGSPVRPDRAAEVLLLGDSFANIYSHAGLGWGEGAGLPEQLAFHLQRPVDTIIMNDGGAFTTRQSLAAELARGERSLEGKRIVVYEFAVRELVAGDWKVIPMPPAPAKRQEPSPAAEVLATAVVSTITRVPDPRSTPYNDCLIAIHLTDIRVEASGAPFVHSEILAYIWGMRDRRVLPEASLAAGSTITIRLTPWADVAAEYESYQRIELDDPNALLLEPYWGEVVSE